jgi:hypothetical protein|tara:strand:+ start:1788 stop:2264 length:477 start_codon:yes stop_codon:yes gene_type:complete
MNLDLIDFQTRGDLDGETLRENYKNAINQYQKSLEEKNYIVSFILATTLYEERLTICYLLLKWYENDKNFDMEKKPTQSDIIDVDIKTKLKFIQQKKYINNKKVNKALWVSNSRNILIHMSFHNLDNYSFELCENTMDLFRKIDEISRKIKEDLGFSR